VRRRDRDPALTLLRCLVDLIENATNWANPTVASTFVIAAVNVVLP